MAKLETEGVKVYPKPHALGIIKNKIHQKQFYKEHEVPSAEFLITENLEALRAQANFIPAVHKIASGGYDGRGVQVISNNQSIDKGFEYTGRTSKNSWTSIKIIAIIIGVNEKARRQLYPAVDMAFN